MLLFATVLMLMLVVCNCNHFRGGTISWRPTGKPLEVEFTYKLGWTYGGGAGCTDALSGQYVNRATFQWKYATGYGTSAIISNAGYTCSSASRRHNWEQGEYLFTYTFPTAGQFTVQYTGCCWIMLDYGSGGSNWAIATNVDLRPRSDLKQPNSSPVYTGYPIYSIKFGCTSTIRLQVSDADNDNIRCRWATGTECDSVCSAIPNAVLNQNDCTLTFTANNKQGGIYAVAIMIEDKPKSTISTGGKTYTTSDVLSSVPVQFLVETPSIARRQCSDRPIFVDPTPSGTIDINVHQGEQLVLQFYVHSVGANITSFALSASPGVQKSAISSAVGRPDVYLITVTWTPSMAQTGRHTLCADATDFYGLNTDPHCIQIKVLDTDPCDSNPCQNSGTCTRVGTTASFKCSCLGGYTGRMCEIELNECTSKPCLNNATCTDIVDGFFCTCSPGFDGILCENDINECQSSPCMNSGTCSDHVNMYQCACQPGFTGSVCQVDIDECISRPCFNNGTCIDDVNRYSCVCKPGVTGSNCEIDIDECQSTPCLNNGTCLDQINSCTCNCQPGYTGTLCGIDINECQSSPCMNSGTCSDHVDMYQCACQPGFTGSVCQVDIDECMSRPCFNNGTCIDDVNGYSCLCQPGFNGTNCEIDIDECQSTPCLNNGTCLDQVNSYICNCQPGYTGTLCGIDVNECQSNPCMNSGTCSDHVNMYQCACQPGFTGSACQVDIDECISRPCFNNGTCIDDINGYSCLCQPGFTGSYCEIDIDECQSTPCLNNGTCLDQVNSYTCDCQPGYSGTFCAKDMDECQSNPCLHNGTCFDLINNFFCGCEKGYNGTYCETDIDDCLGMPCLNDGNCTDLLNSFICTCPQAFTGEICQTGLDPCSSTPCKNNGKCESHNRTLLTCSCAHGWAGINCAYRRQNDYFVNSSLMTGLHMHYSGCDCFLGNSEKHLCHKYNTRQSIGYGALGTFLGIVTVVALYILTECFLTKTFPSHDETTRQELHIAKDDPYIKGDLGHVESAVKENEVPVKQEKNKPEKVKQNIHGHKHRKCWACDVKYNAVPPPRFW